MEFLSQKKSHEYISEDFKNLDEALSHATHLAVGAHPDDIELMAGHGILECLSNDNFHFAGVTCCTGSGSARGESFKELDAEQMTELRRQEQVQSAELGKYASVLQLGFESEQIKKNLNQELLSDLKNIIEKSQPQIIYTHNLMDKHQTHVSVVVHLIEALRELNYQPKALYGCEVWRGLDWVADEQKIILPIDDPGFVAELVKQSNTF